MYEIAKHLWNVVKGFTNFRILRGRGCGVKIEPRRNTLVVRATVGIHSGVEPRLPDERFEQRMKRLVDGSTVHLTLSYRLKGQARSHAQGCTRKLLLGRDSLDDLAVI
jgi:hypothetical protein